MTETTISAPRARVHPLRAEVRITRNPTGDGYAWSLHILGPTEPTALGIARYTVARFSGTEPSVEWCCVEMAWLAWQHGVDESELVGALGDVTAVVLDDARECGRA